MNRSITQVTKHVQIPQSHVDKVVDLPVVIQRLVPQIQCAQDGGSPVDPPGNQARRVSTDSKRRQDGRRACGEAATGPSNSDSGKDLEVPTVQLTDRVMNVPVIMQITLVTKQVKIPQTVHIDKGVNMPVVKQRQVPQIQTPRLTVEVPAARFTDRVMTVPVIMQMRHPLHSFRGKLWR